jgi:hypothetical protein
MTRSEASGTAPPEVRLRTQLKVRRFSSDRIAVGCFRE